MAQRTERAVLNHLIETCTDAARGFRCAADHVKSPRLETALVAAAAQREECAEDLRPHAQRLGGAATADGTAIAAVHRGWIDLMAKLTKDDRAVFMEVAFGDGITLEAFKDAMEGMLSPDTRDLVERQYADIGFGHDRLIELNAGEAVLK